MLVFEAQDGFQISCVSLTKITLATEWKVHRPLPIPSYFSCGKYFSTKKVHRLSDAVLNLLAFVFLDYRVLQGI